MNLTIVNKPQNAPAIPAGYAAIFIIIATLMVIEPVVSETLETDNPRSNEQKKALNQSPDEAKASDQGSEVPDDTIKRILKRNQLIYENMKERRELLVNKTLQAADKNQVEVSERLYKFSSDVDNFFSDPEFEQENRESRMRFSFTNTFQKHEDPLYKPRIGLSLALPNTQNRLRLRMQSDEEENETDNGNESILTSVADSSFSTALGLAVLANEVIDIQADLGVKFRTPLEPFTSLRLRRSFHLKDIELRVTETFKWQKYDGKTSRSRMDIEYPIGENYFFRTTSQLTYWDINSYWDGRQSVTLFEQRSPKSVIAYSVGLSGQNEDSDFEKKKYQVNNYWIELRYRKNFYDNWLFYDIAPGIIRPRLYDFDTSPRLSLKLEAVYGNI